MLEILRETKDYIVLNKPSGLITESNQYENSLEAELKKYLADSGAKNPFVGVVHRLDRVTSGCVLFAKKKSALVYFNSQIEERKLKKKYLAIVPSQDTKLPRKLVDYLIKDNKNKKAIVGKKGDINSKYSKLEIELLGKKDLSLLEIKLHTGRFHQIRVQLANISLPVYGDTKYGSDYSLSDNRICLHAKSLSFIEFNGSENVEVIAAKPDFYPWTAF